MDNFTLTTVENTAQHSPSFTSKLAITFVIGLLFLIGVIGSSLTMIVIRLNSSLHTKANYFIFSLCVSDLISALVCSPLWLYRRTWGFDRWQWGEFLCKFYWVSDFATNYVTSLHILSFAVLRFVAVKRPFQISKISKKFVSYYLGGLWFVSSLIAIPLIFIMGVEFNRAHAEYGSNNWPSCSVKIVGSGCCVQQYSNYFSVMDPLMFYLPDLAIIILSLLITKELVVRRRWRRRHTSASSQSKPRKLVRRPWKLNPTRHDTDVFKDSEVIVATKSLDLNSKSQITSRDSLSDGEKKSDKKQIVKTLSHPPRHHVTKCEPKTLSQLERNTFAQLTLIVVAFMIGYVPFTVYLVWASTTPDAAKAYSSDYWFGVVSYVCLRVSECINPIMYSIGSKAIRDKTTELLRKIAARN